MGKACNTVLTCALVTVVSTGWMGVDLALGGSGGPGLDTEICCFSVDHKSPFSGSRKDTWCNENVTNQPTTTNYSTRVLHY